MSENDAGVEAETELDRGGWDYGGSYAAPEAEARENVNRFGCSNVVTFVPGWFADTIAVSPPDAPVRLVYIDCDLAKGTLEVLDGIIERLVPDGVVFSQDFHIASVRDVLAPEALSDRFGRPAEVRPIVRNLASVTFTTS